MKDFLIVVIGLGIIVGVVAAASQHAIKSQEPAKPTQQTQKH